MSQFPRKEKMAINLVRRENEDSYRVVDNVDMMFLKNSGRVVAEGKMREDSKFIGSFYIELENK